MNFTLLSLFVLSFVILAYNALTNYDTSAQMKKQNNNYLAVSHRNKAIVYGILCIIFVVAFACNRDEFLSINQFNNCPMREDNNATSSSETCPWTVLEHGSTVARVNFKLPITT